MIAKNTYIDSCWDMIIVVKVARTILVEEASNVSLSNLREKIVRKIGSMSVIDSKNLI